MGDMTLFIADGYRAIFATEHSPDITYSSSSCCDDTHCHRQEIRHVHGLVTCSHCAHEPVTHYDALESGCSFFCYSLDSCGT